MSLLLLISLNADLALASSRGKTGSSTAGCGGCHGNSASANTSGSFSAPSTTVAPGDVLLVQFTVSNATMSGAGLDVSASGGTLSAGSNTQLSAGEITHTGTEAMAGGSFTFDFSWTAPASSGVYTLYGAANAVNSNRGDTGDAWNVATYQITVVGASCPDDDGDGVTTCDGDCDDGDAAISPLALEVCNNVDDDCDSLVDSADGSINGAPTWYSDNDRDGYGGGGGTMSCNQPPDTSSDSGDCDDADPAIYPGAPEDCAGSVDSNCDGAVGSADLDGDGYDGCVDCNESSGAINPGAPELCNHIDDNCDNVVDNDATGGTTYYMDMDMDGWGDSAMSLAACDPPVGYVTQSGDCDDNDPAVSPSAAEAWYDGIDTDCSGGSDFDQDRDGVDSDDWGGTDCDDLDATVQTCDTGTTDDSAATDDTATADDSAPTEDDGKDDGGGCGYAGGAAGLYGLAAGLALLTRRRR